MTAERYQHLVQIGVGREGIVYRAFDSQRNEEIELRRLYAAADDERWPVLMRRLRLAAKFQHPLALPLVALHLEEQPPTVVVPADDRPTLASVLTPHVPLPPHEVAVLGHQLAAVLAAAHRLGLRHGSLHPQAVRCDEQRHMRLDFTGINGGEYEGCADDPLYAKDTDDIRNLAILLLWLASGRSLAPNSLANHAAKNEEIERAALDTSLASLIRDMLAEDADDIPAAAEVEMRLGGLLGSHAHTRIVPLPTNERTVDGEVQAFAPSRYLAAKDALPKQLGRFRLLEPIGQGGMGIVFRAEDIGDGSIVAVKIPLDEWQGDAAARRRFRKEARLLAEVRNPYVARLLEVNEDAGILYLAMEFVEGPNLRCVLEAEGPVPEATALAYIADAARALVEPHRSGIVHRDVKLENLVRIRHGDGFRVKLLDFGLARSLRESESLRLTQANERIGTPLYMAPEQCRGDSVDARADVYALGANLFHLLAGRPPFESASLMQLASQHCHETPPQLTRLRPGISEAVSRLIVKTLSKSPQDRHADAGELLDDLERLQRGEPTDLILHPRLPDHDPRRANCFEWQWRLEASPEQLWPYVSNTERLNRAIGLPAVEYTHKADPRGGTRRFGHTRKFGLHLNWEEHPFEWLENRRMGVLRRYDSGPLKWLISEVELTPLLGSGTLLTHRVRLEPSGLLGRLLAARQIGVDTRRALDRVYRRIDATLSAGSRNLAAVDSFEASHRLSHAGAERLLGLLDKLVAHGVERPVVEALGEFLAHAPIQEVARIRPLALAERLNVPSQQMIAACLHGAREGLFVLLWDILCPICRISSEHKDTLRELTEHARCEACNREFPLDFANSVELIFRIHPTVRSNAVGFYCAGGPAHSPHVAAQVRLAPGERMVLNLDLGEGAHRLRGPQLSYAVDFRVHREAQAMRWELDVCRGPSSELPRTLRLGGQTFVLFNDAKSETLVRIERTASRADAWTAARAASSPLFRKLFPEEVLSEGQLLSVANLTFLVTVSAQASELYAALGDNRAFEVIHRHLRFLEDFIRSEGGSVVKTIDEGVVAVFHDTVAAVRVACTLQAPPTESRAGSPLRLRVGVHRGPALATTVNDRVDYFGSTVKLACALARRAADGEVLLSEVLAVDPPVAAWVQGRRLANDLFSFQPPELPPCLIQRLQPHPTDHPVRRDPMGSEVSDLSFRAHLSAKR